MMADAIRAWTLLRRALGCHFLCTEDYYQGKEWHVRILLYFCMVLPKRMLCTRNAWSTSAITSLTAAPCRAKLVLPIRLFYLTSCKPTKTAGYCLIFHLHTQHNTAAFLTLLRTHIQMTRATHCFILRWRLRLAFCFCDMQTSSAKDFKK